MKKNLKLQNKNLLSKISFGSGCCFCGICNRIGSRTGSFQSGSNHRSFNRPSWSCNSDVRFSSIFYFKISVHLVNRFLFSFRTQEVYFERTEMEKILKKYILTNKSTKSLTQNNILHMRYGKTKILFRKLMNYRF